jgi:hypothetical protein
MKNLTRRRGVAEEISRMEHINGALRASEIRRMMRWGTTLLKLRVLRGSA